MDPKSINIKDFSYELPESRIAKFPLAERDASRLLFYNQGAIDAHPFRALPALLPADTLLVFNNTKVIHARLHFTLPNGKQLEILCLEPLMPAEYQQNFSSRAKVRWKCLVGGNRKWKTGAIEKTIPSPSGEVQLRASRISRIENAFEIEFEWDNPSLAFGELLAAAGIIPLPPYLNRENVPEDEDRYQTVYAKTQGSVAAPTAGLHFTDRVFEDLKQQGASALYVTLHVGAGTFKPVSAEALADHHMHEESIYIDQQTLAVLIGHLQQGKPVIPVGTTSMRLLESLYWHGQAICAGQPSSFIDVQQWAPYEEGIRPSATESFLAIQQAMAAQQQDTLQGYTQLIIAPGYSFRVCNGIITNFHQPQSTLLLLIAALIGKDWKAVYDFALSRDFRFLSYGDSSLLLP
ncbi:MAG: S-adenosylmethionine:tRNA ribosyltransferase-isomerase [Phaeodactylibacter sp.]|uniref:S-adenosylmethionine:tRNA ribosyltransferase-isomerase n=1 Tax=Phaeodactylibacter sp. TaxID=1940289 RepID=UPI0032EF1304